MSHQQVSAADWAVQPEKSLTGDVLITLDDGSSLRAHSIYLQHASSVFSNVLELHQSTTAPDAPVSSRPTRSAAKRPKTDTPAVPELKKLPLPRTTRKQAQLLLYCLYAWSREASMDALQPPELVELAKVAHTFACEEVLGSVDGALVRMCQAEAAADVRPETDEDSDDEDSFGGWVNAVDAPAQHQLAHELHLTDFEACVGRYMGRHPDDIDLASVDATLAAVLEGARSLCR